jgi:hypothetical protein
MKNRHYASILLIITIFMCIGWSQIWEAYATNRISCTSETWIDMADMSVQIPHHPSAQATPHRYLVIFSISPVWATTAGNVIVAIRMMRDDNPIAYGYLYCINVPGDPPYENLSIQKEDRPGPGNHTYKIQWRVAPGRGAEACEPGVGLPPGHRCLNVIKP